jgi:TP901 family phage tail tape measure protein
MSKPAAVLQIFVDANTGKATTKLRDLDSATKRTSDNAQKHFGSFAKAADLAALAVGGGLVYGMFKAVKAGVVFERQLSTLGAVSHASAGQMKRLESQALKLGESTIFTAKQVAEAQTELAKGGLTAKQILGGGTKSALALAAAGQLELAQAAETTVTAMKLFGIQAKNSESIADGFATAANRTTGDVTDFAMAMKQGGAVAKLAGYSFNNTLAVLESLAEAGVKNSDAGTSLKTSLSQLIKPSTKQAELMKELGFQTETANGEIKKGSGLSKELIRVTEGMTKAERAHVFAVLGGTDGIRTLNALYDEGPAKIRKLEAANKKQGTAQEVAAKQTQNFQGELEQLQGAAETLGIRIFKVMKPALEEAVTWASKLTQEVSAIFSDENLTGPEKFQKSFGLVFDKLIPLFEGVMTQLSEAAAAGAPKAAAAFVRGFMNAGPWAKLFSAAYLYGKFGGAFRGLGSRAGTDMGEGMVTSGGLSGALSKGMKVAGAAAAGYFVAEFGAEVIEKISGSNILEGQSLAASLTHGFNTKGVARSEQDQLQKAAGLNWTKSKGQLDSLQMAVAKTMKKISADAAVGLVSIQKATSTGLGQINETWIKDTPQWRTKTVEAMKASVAAIKSGMDAGTIKTREGQRAINALLSKIHLATGRDPLGVAQAASDGFKKMNAITSGGVREWTAKLGLMPKGAREKAREAMQEMLNAWAQGHPKIEKQVENLTAFENRKFGSTNKLIAQTTTTAMQKATKALLGAQPHFHKFAEVGLGAMASLESGTERAMRNIAENVSGMMKSLHLGNPPDFNVKKALKEMPELGPLPKVKKQRGGPINLGKPSGDSVPAMLERGEYVLNRKAVSAMGKRNLDSINFGAAPRFQKGGSLGAEPELGGSGPLHSIGQGAIHTLYAAASMMLKAAQARSAVSNTPGGGTKGPAGIGSYKGVPMADWVIESLEYASHKGISPQPTSGYRSPTEVVTGPVVAPQGHSEHQGTQYPHGAVDFGGPYDPAALISKMAVVNATKGFKYPLLAPIGFTDDGHASGTGHQRGGLIGALMQGLQSGGSVVKTVGTILARNGLDLESASGILGSSYGESSWNTEAMEPGTHNGGLWGFTASPVSLSDLEAYAASQNKPWGDAAVQTQFMLHHLPTSQRDAMNNLSSVADTTRYFVENWEHPETLDSVPTRIAAGEKAMNMLKADGIHGKGGAYNKESSKEHTYKEDVPKVYKGLKTGSLSIGSSAPKSLPAIAKELKQRKGERKRYKAAIESAEGKKRPGIVQALQQSLHDIEARIGELEAAQKKLRVEKAKRHFTAGLGKQLGKLTGFATPIALAERAFNTAQQYATQTVELEPIEKEGEEGSGVGKMIDWIIGNERPAYADVLWKAGEWRNTILGAERFAAGRWEDKGPLGGLEGGWETSIANTAWQIQASEKIIEKARKDREKFQSSHKKNTPFPEWLQGENKQAALVKEQLPMLAFKEKELRAKLGEAQGEFYPGGSRIKENPTPPIQGSGKLEEELENVQGIHWPGQHERLKSLPIDRVRGRFGGVIWDLQTQISDLELKLGEDFNTLFSNSIPELGELEGGSGSGSSTTDDSARNENLEQLLREANQRELVYNRQRPILEKFAGFHADGGFIPSGKWGIAGEAGPEIVHGPAQVYSNSDSAAMGGGLHVTVNQLPGGGFDVEAELNGRQVEQVKQTINRQSKIGGRGAKTIGQRIAGRGI